MNILPILLSFASVASMSTANVADNTNLPMRRSSKSRQTQQVEPISFYGLNYNTRKGPDWAADQERCKSRAEIVRDLDLLSRITTRIRLLSLVDCNQGALVWSVLKDELANVDMEVWLGLWVGPDPQVFADEYEALVAMIPDITTTSNWQSRLSGISVGSEAIYREDVTISEAIDNLNIVRSRLKRYGMSNVPVAIVDIAPIYSNSQELRLASDTIMTNTFPFWEGLPIDLAISELEIDLGWLLSLPESQGKNFVLSEHGWPSGGYLDDVGIASPENQQRYLEESYCYLKEKGWAYYWFTAIDNDWRQLQDPDNTIEGNWGFLTANLSLKDHFTNFQFSCADGSTYSFATVDWSVQGLPKEEPIDPANASCGLWQGCEALAGDCCPTPVGDFLGCCRIENFLGDDTNVGEDIETGQDTGTSQEEPSCNFCVGQVYSSASVINFSSGNDSVTCSGLTKLILSGLMSTDFCEAERTFIESACCQPTPGPTNRPTLPPTRSPDSPPTEAPTIEPSPVPTENPTTAKPSQNPTVLPTPAPTLPPTRATTGSPTEFPVIISITAPPSVPKTELPTMPPSTGLPTKISDGVAMTMPPSVSKTGHPTSGVDPGTGDVAITVPPIVSPTMLPTSNPTPAAPLTTTFSPTKPPTTAAPTPSPTTSPPTNFPTPGPTPFPTNLPTNPPTNPPTAAPTPFPTTSRPTNGPTPGATTYLPTNLPTRLPTPAPTFQPTKSFDVEESGGAGGDTSSSGGSSSIFPPELIDEEIFPWDNNGGALPAATAEENRNNDANASGGNNSFGGVRRRTIVGVLLSTFATTTTAMVMSLF